MNRYYFLLALVLLMSCKSRDAQKQPEDLASFIKTKTDSLYAAHKVPGILVGVLDGDERIYYSTGYAIAESKTPFDSSAIFEIGSITKTFTAYVLESILTEKGISDTTSIISYLPDSVKQNKALEKITFLSLLNHSSGLPRLPDNMDDVNSKQPYKDYTLDKLFSYLKTAEPRPNGRSNYSNLGFGLAGVLATIISNKPYTQLLLEHIFYPFNIRKKGEIKESGATLSKGFFGPEPVDYWEFNVLEGAGVIKSSAEQMLGYLQSMAVPVNDSAKQVINKLLEPTLTIAPSLQVGRGWHIIERSSKPTVYWHDGGTYGFTTYAAFLKGEKKAVIVAVNQFNQGTVSSGLGEMIIDYISN